MNSFCRNESERLRKGNWRVVQTHWGALRFVFWNVRCWAHKKRHLSQEATSLRTGQGFLLVRRCSQMGVVVFHLCVRLLPFLIQAICVWWQRQKRGFGFSWLSVLSQSWHWAEAPSQGPHSTFRPLASCQSGPKISNTARTQTRGSVLQFWTAVAYILFPSDYYLASQKAASKYLIKTCISDCLTSTWTQQCSFIEFILNQC